MRHRRLNSAGVQHVSGIFFALYLERLLRYIRKPRRLPTADDREHVTILHYLQNFSSPTLQIRGNSTLNKNSQALRLPSFIRALSFERMLPNKNKKRIIQRMENIPPPMPLHSFILPHRTDQKYEGSSFSEETSCAAGAPLRMKMDGLFRRYRWRTLSNRVIEASKSGMRTWSVSKSVCCMACQWEFFAPRPFLPPGKISSV